MSQNKKEVSQWVSEVLNVESKSEKNLEYLYSVLGPVKKDFDFYIYEQQEIPFEAELSNLIESEIDQEAKNHFKGVFMHEIVFKIDEKIFIENINIYEKICPGSTILKLEAFDFVNDEWFLLWQTSKPLDASKPKIFTPAINPTPFKADTVRLTVCGSIYLIDGIEIKGNKFGVEDDQTEYQEANSLSEDLGNLIANELFADVYFEVEGKLIPAHKNILVCRSEYFEELIDSHLKMSSSCSNPEKNPIYLKDMEHHVFMQILNYIYTGLVKYDNDNSASALLIRVAEVARMFYLDELRNLCLYHLSEMINEKNVIRIFNEAFDSCTIPGIFLDLCYEVILENFETISQSEDFCSLDQYLMHKVIQNVVPKLNEIKHSIDEDHSNSNYYEINSYYVEEKG
ncbi:kelch motif [Brachionus plicatilis]|uniref:Kelch motif n=1 Tax=Brachionus plicatilis TaxID=10195 RepID=A0A3M7S8X0_BRAPC|nr:kelch motif [Brachionus plicatilis]